MDTTIHCLIVDHSVMEDPKAVRDCQTTPIGDCQTTPIAQKVDIQQEEMQVK